MKRWFFLLTLVLAASAAVAQTIPGTWTLYPPQTSTYQVSIRPPVNPDGTSTWAWKSTIPIQYDLMQGYGPFVFASYQGGTEGSQTNPLYSYLKFTFATPVPFEQITTLSTDYQFSAGDCWGGSLRWAFYFQDGSAPAYVYYGTDQSTDFTSCKSGSGDQTGLNILGAAFQGDARYEVQGWGAPTYRPYADLLAAKSGKLVTGVNLILDSGWLGTEVLAATYPLNPTVGINGGDTATWTPQTGGLTPVCPSLPATIQVTKTNDGSGLV